MTKRFFSATDGHTTVFRGTDRPVGYRFATWEYANGEPWNLSFSNVWSRSRFPAVEITQEAYARLGDLKRERVAKAGGNPQRATSPQDCWVWNTQLVEEVV